MTRTAFIISLASAVAALTLVAVGYLVGLSALHAVGPGRASFADGVLPSGSAPVLGVLADAPASATPDCPLAALTEN